MSAGKRIIGIGLFFVGFMTTYISFGFHDNLMTVIGVVMTLIGLGYAMGND